MSGYAASARLQGGSPRFVPVAADATTTTDALVAASPRREPARPRRIELVGRAARRPPGGCAWSDLRETWSQTTFYLFDPGELALTGSRPAAPARGCRIARHAHLRSGRPAARPPRDPRLAPWRAFLLAHARVSRRLDEELRLEHDLSIAEYDTLLTIAQAPGRRMRMGPLAERVILSKSGVTRLIDRLVERRARRAQRLPRRCARRRGRPDRPRPGPAPSGLADAPARASASTSCRILDDADLEVIERRMTSVARQAGSGGRATPRARTRGCGRSGDADDR